MTKIFELQKNTILTENFQKFQNFRFLSKKDQFLTRLKMKFSIILSKKSGDLICDKISGYKI